jgi:DnaJ-class molecular chaperone
MDYYKILGVNENASQDDIKKAYKKLAMKNHPDRGGDTKKFQEISQAYDTLGDNQKRAQYDAQKNGFNPFGRAQQHPGFQDINDIFSSFGFAGSPFNFSNARRNRDLTIRVSISLKQSFSGTQIEARFNTPSGQPRTVIVDIPSGVQSGQTIRYPDLGDDSIPNLPRGNLNVQVIVEPDAEWDRRGNDLVYTLNINVLEAMIGCTKEIETLDGNKMPLKLRPGIQHGSEFASGGRGFRDVGTGRTGNLIIIINVEIPAVNNQTLQEELKTLYARIS